MMKEKTHIIRKANDSILDTTLEYVLATFTFVDAGKADGLSVRAVRAVQDLPPRRESDVGYG